MGFVMIYQLKKDLANFFLPELLSCFCELPLGDLNLSCKTLSFLFLNTKRIFSVEIKQNFVRMLTV